MKAAMFHGPNQPLSIEQVEIDEPQDREVLVRTVACGVCHSDLHFIDGLYPHPAPAVLGHEVAGIVERVGPGVTYLKPDDHVIACLSVFCGYCEQCLTGHPNRCYNRASTQRPAAAKPRLSSGGKPVFQFLEISGYAEKILVHENALVKIPNQMPLDRAALIGCGVTTGLGAVINTAKVEPGAKVVVFGLGGIGLNVLQGALMVGADMIVGVDTNPKKRPLAEKFGMTHYVNPAEVKGDLVPHLVELTKGGADYTFECIGNVKTMRQALECAKRGWGQSIIIGVAGAGEEIATRPFQLVTGRTWKGTAFGGARGRTDVPKIVDWYMNKRINIDDLITHTMPLADINKAFDLMHHGESIRSVVVY